MPVLAQGNTANLTLGAHDSITLQNRAGQSASLTVAGTLVNGQHSGTRTYGPYTNGGAVVLVATAGDVYYEVGDGAYAGVTNAVVQVDTTGRPIRTVTPDGQVVGGGARRYQNRAALHHQQRMVAGGSLANRTYHTIAMAPVSEFVMARLILKNLETSAIAVDACALAVTNSGATNAERIVSSQGTTLTGDSSTGWVRATFGGANTVNLPARLGANRPSFTFSDWMPVQSIAPIDGRRRPYILGRCYIPGSQFSYTAYNTTSGQLTNEDAGMWNVSYTQNVAGSSAGTPLGITTPSAFTSTVVDANTTIAGFEFITPSRVLNVAVCGDSITQGQSSANDQVDSAYAYACESLRQAGLNVSLFNLGWAGQTSTQYAQHGFDVVPLVLPDYCFYSVYTPNETISATVANQMYGRAMQFVQYCLERNVTPILAFLAPNNNLDAGADAIVVSLIERCKAAGVAVMDCTSAVSTTDSPRRWIDGTNQDALHPSPAGKVAMGQYISQWMLNSLQFPTSTTLA